MKMGDENTFLTKLTRWFNAQQKGLRVSIMSVGALVVCGAVASIVALGVQDGAGRIEPLPSSEESSAVIVSDLSSASEMPVSLPESSVPEVSALPEEVSSIQVSSPTVSAAAASIIPKAEVASVTQIPASQPASSESVSSQDSAQTAAPVISIDYSKILASNQDVKGQLYLPGTKLNLWVCQGTDNNFYLNHNVYKQKSGWGTPAIDFRTTLTKDARSTNVVIYGHSNDKTGEYFSAIKNYNANGLDFYKEHPTIQFNTIYGDGNYKIIGMFLENVNVKGKSFGYHNFINAKSEEDFNNFVAEVKGRSFLTMPVDTQYGDQLITLSTCLSTTSVNSRYVLVARKVRPGESAEVEVDKAVVNTNMIPASGPLN